MPDTNVTVPADPTPQVSAVVAAVLRLIVVMGGALGFGVAWLNDATIPLIAAAVAAVVGAVWALYEVWRQANLRYAAAVASARGGNAVEHLDYTPKGYRREKGAPRSSVYPRRVRVSKP